MQSTVRVEETRPRVAAPMNRKQRYAWAPAALRRMKRVIAAEIGPTGLLSVLPVLFLVPLCANAATFNQRPASEKSPYVYRLNKSVANHYLGVDVFALPYGSAAYGVGSYDGNELVIEAIYQFTTDPSWDRVIFSKRVRVYPDTLKLDYIRCYGGHGTCDYGTDVLDQPTGISVAPNGQVFVADTNNNRIVVLQFDEVAGQLSFVSELSIAEPEIPLDEPFGVSWDHAGTPFDFQDDYLWVVDGGNHRLVKFRLSDGTVSGIYESFESCVPGEGPITLRYPQGIACARQYGHELDLRDPDCGIIFVADTGKGRILRLRDCGGDLEAYCDGSYGYSLDNAVAPDIVPPDPFFANVDADEYGSVYVPDQTNSRLYKLSGSASGTYPILPLEVYGAQGRGDVPNTFFHPFSTARMRARVLWTDGFNRWMSIDEVYTAEKWTDDTGGTRHEVGIDAAVSYVEPYSYGVDFGAYNTEYGLVSADVLDADGRRVKSLCAESALPPQEWQFFWDGADTLGNAAPQGDYTFRVTAQDGMWRGDGEPEVAVVDTSFSFPEPIESVRLEIPNGGEVWQQGSIQTIAWDIDGLGPGKSIDILCSWDGGLEWETIASGLDASQRTYEWTVYSPYHTESCLVRVDAYYRFADESEDRYKSDTSAAAFTICHATAAFSGLSSVSQEPSTPGYRCPGGDAGSVSLNVQLRNCLGDPVGSVPAQDVVAVVSEDTSGTAVACTGASFHAETDTDSQGMTHIAIPEVAGCGELALDIYAQGILIGQETVPVKSPDLNGDCVVDAEDDNLFFEHMVLQNPCADFNQDGLVDASDYDILHQHYAPDGSVYHFSVDPGYSSANPTASNPSCMVLCPKGDMESLSTIVIARNAHNAGFPHSSIPADSIWAQLLFPAGGEPPYVPPEWHRFRFLCRPDCTRAIADSPTWGPEKTTITVNSGGGHHEEVRAWQEGGWQGSTVDFYIGGQKVGQWQGLFKSPDIDASGTVDGTDVSIWSDDNWYCNPPSSMDPECHFRSDLDCNGTVGYEDFDIINHHYKHRCGAESQMAAQDRSLPSSWTVADAKRIRARLSNSALDYLLRKDLHPELRALLTHVRALDEPDSLAAAGGHVRPAEMDLLPRKTSLAQNTPNPSTGPALIRYQIAPPGGHVRIVVFDAAGRLVRTLVDQDLPPGFYSAQWDGRRDDGRPLPCGVYFYQLKAPGYTSSRRMLLAH